MLRVLYHTFETVRYKSPADVNHRDAVIFFKKYLPLAEIESTFICNDEERFDVFLSWFCPSYVEGDEGTLVRVLRVLS